MKRRITRGAALFVDLVLMQLPFTLATAVGLVVARSSDERWWLTAPATVLLVSWALVFGGLPYVYWRRGSELRVKVRQ